MSKKVMLNDDCHPYSQTAPFAFALSVSNATIEFEISTIKSILEPSPELAQFMKKYQGTAGYALPKQEVEAYIDKKDAEDFEGYNLAILLPAGTAKAVREALFPEVISINGPKSLYLPFDWCLINQQVLKENGTELEPGTFHTFIFTPIPIQNSDALLIGQFEKPIAGNNTGSYSGFISCLRKENGDFSKAKEELKTLSSFTEVLACPKPH